MASDCIIRRRVNGYALVPSEGGKRLYAHRVAWEQTNGPIPEGHHIHHACGNKACVNVDHLLAVTPAEHYALHRRCDHEDRGMRPDGRTYCRICKREQERDRKRERYRTDPEFRAKLIARVAAARQPTVGVGSIA